MNGDGQSAPAGQLLAAPIVVEVTDADGAPVEGATVEFALTSAGTGAEVQPATATTDANGHAEAHLLLGDKLGLQTGEARVVMEGAPAPRISFTAVATAGTAPAPEPDPNEPPNADFEVHCQDLTCTFVDRSTDADGNLVNWEWDFGDGTGASERNSAHTYGAPGRYAVTLTVRDNDGAEGTKLRDAEPKAPAPNKPPDADFEVHCIGLICTFIDTSKDDDGTIVAWQWSFGDGASSTERNPVHVYAGSGDYDVFVTVTDNDGAADTKSRRADPRD